MICLYVTSFSNLFGRPKAVAQLVEALCYKPEVAGSTSDGAIEIFH